MRNALITALLITIFTAPLAQAGAPIPGPGPQPQPKPPVFLKTGTVEQNVFATPKKKKPRRKVHRTAPKPKTTAAPVHKPRTTRPVVRHARPAVRRPKLVPQKPLNLSDIPTVRSKARQLIEVGSVKSADWLLKKAIEANPEEEALTNDLADLSLERAKKLIAAGYLECALIRLREALFLNPDLAEARDLLNEVLRKLGKDPMNPDVRLAMASELVAQNRFVAAIVEYRESLALRPSVQGYMGLADMYTKSQQPDLARAAMAEAANLDPNNAVLQRRLAASGGAGSLAAGSNAPNVLNPMSNEVERSKAGRILVNLWHSNSMDKYSEFYKKTDPRAYAHAGSSTTRKPTYSQPVKLQSTTSTPAPKASARPPAISTAASPRAMSAGDGFDLPSWYQGPPITNQARSVPDAPRAPVAPAASADGFDQPRYTPSPRLNGNGYGATDSLHPVESQRGSTESMGPEAGFVPQSGPKADPRAVPTRGGMMSFDPEELRQQMSAQARPQNPGFQPISNVIPAGQIEECACDPSDQ